MNQWESKTGRLAATEIKKNVTLPLINFFFSKLIKEQAKINSLVTWLKTENGGKAPLTTKMQTLSATFAILHTQHCIRVHQPLSNATTSISTSAVLLFTSEKRARLPPLTLSKHLSLENKATGERGGWRWRVEGGDLNIPSFIITKNLIAITGNHMSGLTFPSSSTLS